jgi:hypothetical protein
MLAILISSNFIIFLSEIFYVNMAIKCLTLSSEIGNRALNSSFLSLGNTLNVEEIPVMFFYKSSADCLHHENVNNSMNIYLTKNSC